MKTSALAATLAASLLSLSWPAAAGQHQTENGHQAHSTPAAHAHPEAEHASSSGQPGDPRQVDRTIEVVLSDDMRFTPATIEVKSGETIRFAVYNSGQTDHELVIGPLDELRAHAEIMRAQPDMVHTEPNQVYLKPGQRGALVWHFTHAGTVDFACTIPGHLEAGMTGKINIDS